ncbi:AMP-dependent synthetase/ligase [Estrella lausannensis]|uniref:Long-chain-fatty-acid--CoA ligase n=1 Tax=Estrella lausannensis TaxID=483423 RepID=A0A0H5DS05_9BACT|nr:long-chain fatty acid--CoA ligase [Estrella lausannensis]CRX38504.1 Long-chain-fatty-acid--CoA ligase [Estrella lausannensis]
MEPINSFAELYRVLKGYKENPKLLAYQTDSGFEPVSSSEMLDSIKYFALGLKQLGIKKGDMIGILAGSSPRWTIADIAIAISGAVSIPLFANISHENYEFEMRQTEMKYLIVAGKEQWEMYEKHKELIETTINLYDEEVRHEAHRFSEIIEQGKALEEKQPQLFEEMLDMVNPNDLASIVYTSGSTGMPKGAMLTQKNLLAHAHFDPFSFDRDSDLYLNILPLAHIFGRTVNYIVLAKGISTFYLRDIKTVGKVCKELHPTMSVLVPRLLEKIYAKMLANVQNAGFLKRTLGQWAFDLANSEDDSSLYKQLMHPIADKIVYSALREALGGKFRVILTGGAALNPHLYHFFLDIGLPIYEGWGMTEACPVGLNLPGYLKIGSVGKSLQGMEVKLSPEGEILVKGPCKMLGYYKNPEATKRALDSEGWLHTGDKGKIDDEGFVYIIGRMKELFKLSTGKFIAPVPIEQILTKAPLIDMAMVVAEGRSFATALLFPDHEVLNALKKAHGKESASDEEFLSSDFVKQEMKRLLEELNKHVNHWEEVRDFRFITQPPAIETGELTPTMKLRRDFVSLKYKDAIESMYQVEPGAVDGDYGG